MIEKYCVRLNGELSKEDFLCALGCNDEDFELDPEGNPVTVWVTTCISQAVLESWDGVEGVVVANG